MDRTSLADVAATKITELVRNNVLKPGSHINIDALSRQFDISQTPIREALRKLVSDGLVVYKTKRGYSVRNLSLHEYLQVSEILQVLEIHMLRELAAMPFLVDIKELRQINVELEAALPWMDCDRIGKLNDKFHYMLYKNYPNTIMTDYLHDLWAGMCIRRNNMYKNKIFLNKIKGEHEQILKAIEDGCPDMAEAAIKGHYQSGRESAIMFFPVEA